MIIYRIIINIILLISPIIILIRLIKKKEDPKRFKEKFCFFSQKRSSGKTIWFHGASVGEIQSIVPLIEKINKDKKIKTILVTSNTLSSSKILQKLSLKKVIHQFFPIDTYFHTSKFLNYWKPSAAFFIDSEIWPNMILNLKKNRIPIILLNARITKKSFMRWKKISFFAKKIFENFDLCLTANKNSFKLLKKLGSHNIKFLGNLKFSQSENDKIILKEKLIKFITTRKSWCASSTHDIEEKFCGLVHNELKKKYTNLFTIIIPRHIDRVESIANELKNLNLRVHVHGSKKMIQSDVDIYLVDEYGKTKSFYKFCKNIFLGGSLINHGGQNPLEAARYGCNILHGPNTQNFSEIYKFLKHNKISKKVYNQKQIVKHLDLLLSKKSDSKKIQKKLKFIGHKILENTYKEVKLVLSNEI